jgi:hypothetical protein
VDLNDIWQEHKRWILGVLGGAAVFFVARSVIGSVFDPETPWRGAMSTVAQVNKAELYTAQSRDKATQDRTVLAAASGEARKKTEFRPAGDLDLTDQQGSVSVHYNTVTSDVKKRIRAEADRLNVRIEAKELGLPANSPTDRDEIQRTLIGLDLVREALTRLFDVAEKVRAQRDDAIAVESVQKIQIQARPQVRRGGAAAALAGKARPIEDLLDQVDVQLEFRADAPTVTGLLEAFRNHERPILVDKLKIEEGKDPGDPLGVVLTLVGLRLREE